MVTGVTCSATGRQWQTCASRCLHCSPSSRDLNTSIVFCRGQGENFRKKLLPEYKANRKKRRPPGNYTKFLAEANSMARQLGCDVWRHPGIEGDDIIGLYLQEGDVVVSGDKDMHTLAGAHLFA